MRKYFLRVGNSIHFTVLIFYVWFASFIIKNKFKNFTAIFIAAKKRGIFLVSHLHCVITTFTIYIFITYAVYSARWKRKIIYDASGGNVCVYETSRIRCKRLFLLWELSSKIFVSIYKNYFNEFFSQNNNNNKNIRMTWQHQSQRSLCVVDFIFLSHSLLTCSCKNHDDDMLEK